jgi:hypothetical protein
MGRRIVAEAVQQTAPTADDYLSRLAKYIPVEIVGLYLFAAGVIPRTSGSADTTALWVVFVACLVFTPIYMWIVTRREGGKPLWPQVILATIAFPIWVLAMGGPFEGLSWYRSYIFAIVLAFATVVFGLVQPKPGT